MKIGYLLLIGTLFLGLAGCDSVETYAPVTEISSIEPTPLSGVHRVIKGESLYEIAWRYGLDYRYLAARNHIRPPYEIYAGQIIFVRGKPSQKTHINKVNVSKNTIKHIVVSKKYDRRPLMLNKNKPKHIVIIEPNYTIFKWVWPVKGTTVNRLSPFNKGMNIYGSEGMAIYAALPGKVVYAGAGLRGYGNLIIIKHNSSYLSAYAHNSKIFVQEGNWVQKGQKIAEMGHTGTDKTMLHFEIRRNGHPINPSSLYPKIRI